MPCLTVIERKIEKKNKLHINFEKGLLYIFISRRLSPVQGKGNSLLPVAICFYIRKLVPRSGGKRAILGYVWKNGPVQEDINPSIYIIDLTPLVYKNTTFYRSIFF